MLPPTDVCLRAVSAKDSRFDGVFVTAVVTTRVYCRPSCPAMTPKAANCRFFPTAAAAQGAGFRACKRCLPDATPGSPEWDRRADLVARAVKLIADGVVDREGVGGLASRLGYSRRQLERALGDELGAGPLALARASRAQTARILVETTDLPMAHVAVAAGFGSVRQFNGTVQEVFAVPPVELRSRARWRRPGGGRSGGGTTAASLSLRLPYRLPLWPGNLFGHLAATSVPGVEEWRDGAFRRTLRLPGGPGLVALRPAAGHVDATLSLADVRDLSVAVQRCRRLLDLDADPVAVDEALAADEHLAPLVRAAPGRRVPRTVDGVELAVRAVLGQQVSTKAAQRLGGRLTTLLGEEVADPGGGLTHLFPEPGPIAGVDPGRLGLPRARAATLVAMAEALAGGDIDLGPGADWGVARARLAALRGVGPWTIETIAMRALGDPDAFPVGDLGLRSAARALGVDGGPAELVARSGAWRPWRAYATQHLWALGPHPINAIPDPPGAAA
ncbi:MAG: DNA-3-methyladenine glycosylase 2 family protein [Acidimicrobiales bacterium]